MSKRPCVKVTTCVRSLYTREMSVAMREHAAASPGAGMNGNAIECSLGVVMTKFDQNRVKDLGARRVDDRHTDTHTDRQTNKRRQ